jgi:hypothetical protein
MGVARFSPGYPEHYSASPALPNDINSIPCTKSSHRIRVAPRGVTAGDGILHRRSVSALLVFALARLHSFNAAPASYRSSIATLSRPSVVLRTRWACPTFSGLHRGDMPTMKTRPDSRSLASVYGETRRRRDWAGPLHDGTDAHTTSPGHLIVDERIAALIDANPRERPSANRGHSAIGSAPFGPHVTTGISEVSSSIRTLRLAARWLTDNSCLLLVLQIAAGPCLV